MQDCVLLRYVSLHGWRKYVRVLVAPCVASFGPSKLHGAVHVTNACQLCAEAHQQVSDSALHVTNACRLCAEPRADLLQPCYVWGQHVPVLVVRCDSHAIPHGEDPCLRSGQLFDWLLSHVTVSEAWVCSHSEMVAVVCTHHVCL